MEWYLLAAACAGALLIVIASWQTRDAVTVTTITALVLLVAVPAGRLSPSSPFSSLNFMVPVVVSVLGICGLIKSGSLKSSAWPFAMTLALIGAIGTAIQPDDGEWRVAFLFLIVMTTAVAVGSVIRVVSIEGRVASSAIVLAVLESVLGLIEFSGVIPTPLWFQPDAINVMNGRESGGYYPSELLEGSIRAQGTLGHPLLLSFLLLMSLPLILSRSKKWRIPAAAIILLGIFSSGSRSGLILASVMLLLMARRGTTRVYLVLSACAVGFASFPYLLQIAREFSASGSFFHRIEALESMSRLLFDRGFTRAIFGDGFNSLTRIYREGLLQTDGLIAIDNQVVSIFALFGLAGTLTFAVLFSRAYRRANRGARNVLALCALQFLVFDVTAWYFSMFVLFVILSFCMTDSGTRTPTRSGVNLVRNSTRRQMTESQ